MMYIPYCTSKPGEVKTIIFTFVSVNRIMWDSEIPPGANIHGLRRGSVDFDALFYI